MIFRRSAVLFSWLVLSSATALGQEGPRWSTSLQEALADAKKRGTCVFLHVSREGERASRALLRQLLAEEEVMETSESLVCLLALTADDGVPLFGRGDGTFSNITREEAREVYRSVRDAYLAPAGDGRVEAPSCIFLSAEGEVVLRVTGWLTRAQLLWCFSEARALTDGPANERPEKDRPRNVPGRGHRAVPALVGTALDDALAAAEGEPPGPTRVNALRDLLGTPHERTLSYIRRQLDEPWADALGAKLRKRILHAIGTFAHPAYAAVLETHSRDANPSVRDQAIVALEQMGSREVVKTLLGALRGEGDDLLRKNLFRALAACGEADRTVRKTVLRAARLEKDEIVRANALIALGSLVSDKEVTQALERMLRSRIVRDRRAASLAMGLSLDERHLPAVREALEGSADEAEKELHERVVRVLEGEASPETLDDLVREVAADQTARGRVYGREK